MSVTRTLRGLVGLRRIGAAERRRERKLGFLGVGAQKAGTTTLYKLLKMHPDIEVPRKELHYFNRDGKFGPDHRPLAGGYDELHQRYYFDTPIAGEITPLYMYWRPSIARIHAYNPDAKIIVLLRNPVSRAYSQWGHYMRKGIPFAPFESRIKKEVKKLRRNPGFQSGRLSQLARSRYGAQIREIKALFPPDQVMFIKAEAFFKSQLPVTDDVCRFLGLEPLSKFRTPAPVKSNTGIVRPITAEQWRIAYKHLKHDIDIVEEELGWDCSDWRKPPSEKG